jgi:3'-5' exoribonuclease
VSAAAGAGASPREWVGDEPFPWPPTLGLADGEAVTACFSVVQASTGRTRNDAPFLRLQLTDSHGTVDARLWNDVELLADALRPGAYIGVRGRMETYQEQRQLRIDEAALLQVELDDLVLFLPRAARPGEQMDAELAAFIDSVNDDALRRLLLLLLGPDSETGHGFRLAPAAKQNHHAYLGGLLEHTLSVTTVCDGLARHYGAALDRDLLVGAALLHDIGKVREIGARAGFPYTDEGKLLGHILIGLQMVADAARDVPELPAQRLLLLQHLIASHQGRYEWHSPREPRTLEALVLHYADDLDAKLNQASSLVHNVTAGWTAYDRGFGRDFLRHLHAGAAPPPRAPELPAAHAAEPHHGAPHGAPHGAAHKAHGDAPADPPTELPESNAGDAPNDAPGDAPPDAPPDAPRRAAPDGAGSEPGAPDTLDLFADS